MSKGHKVFFLDRDGTINVDHGYVYEMAKWEWTPKAIEALRNLQEQEFKLVVLTNQSGIGEGLYNEIDMLDLHNYMVMELEKEGIILADIQYCPHKRDAGCNCRKPNAGMAYQAEEKIGPINYEESWMIGDKLADLQVGKTLGTKTALVKSKYWIDDDLTDQPDLIVESLYEASLAVRKNLNA